MTLVVRQNFKMLLLVFVALLTFACRQTDTTRSTVKWGVHEYGTNANVLNLLPNQTLEICAPNEEWVNAAKGAVQQWATAIGRWGFFEIKPCNSSANLRINMSGFGQAGLNYFTETPGRIYIQSNATGDMLKALVLHEYGHSFGLCDQYMDAGRAGCSSTAERQDNSEIMGATSENKLKLTPGDIAGVTAASKINIKANTEWDSFLATKPQVPTTPSTPSTPQQTQSLFAQVLDGSVMGSVSIRISVPKNTVPTLCLQGGTQVACTSANAIALTKGVSPATDRDVYQTASDLTSLASSGKNIFQAVLASQGQSVINRFAVTAK